MAFGSFLFTVFLLILSALRFTFADSIQGCGGFVEAGTGLIKSRKPSDGKLDYSHITVELRTLDGFVKESTQCAPNGYYFMPVYDKGSYVLKVNGPQGWSWDPRQVPIVVDHTGCNGNEDINFRFTGFTVSGRVVGAVGGESCSKQGGGPSGVTMKLLSSTGDHISTVLTSSGGSYLFINIIPGKYQLHASHKDFIVQVQGSTEVELGFGNGLIDDIFFVPGYDLCGSVVAQGNPILGVHIYLFSNDVSELVCPEGAGNAPGQRKALCHALSDAEGTFTFKSIPCGAYELVPYYKGENTVFDVSPSSIPVSVEHGHATISQKFQVTGFSIGGRVVDGNGIGVYGVKITVDGQERSTTDKKGYYKLDQVTSSRYTIEAKKEHYKFKTLDNFLVLPNMASIADVQAVSYEVCGTVQMDSGFQAKVALTHGPENVKPQAKQTDESGNFCFEVPAGEYRLSALAAKSDNTPGLVFLPAYVDAVVNSPVLNVQFYQAQVNVIGEVFCKEKCDSLVSILLARLDGKKERKTVYLTDDKSNFSFLNIFPGNYRLEVKHNSPEDTSADDNWCWEKKFIDVTVGTEDVKGISFLQKGYWVNVISTHEVDAYMNQPDGSRVDLKVKKGFQRLCVESPGVHDIQFVESCIFFGNSSLKIDTSNQSPVYLRGEKYLIKGQIHIDSSLQDSELPENLIVTMLNHEGVPLDGTPARPVHQGEDQFTVYEYSFWANPGEKITFSPQDYWKEGKRQLLFYPRQHNVSVTHNGCQAPVPPFSARTGLYIEGSISPPLLDVHIKIFANGDSNNGLLKKGDLALETITDSDGLFVGGPLHDDIAYRTEASKPGYHVKQIGPHSFSCQKLGQISVHVTSKHDATEHFPPVLLSLSGEDGYRNNSISGAGGEFLFNNLFPGSFYLRPLLKEYAFSPSAQAIDIGSGEAREVTFEATRVAYSAIGAVTLLSGQPMEGVAIEARSESKGYYEETTTDSSGTYRLRGLHPDTIYAIKVIHKGDPDTSRIERASPESVTVKVISEDIKGLDFLVFEQPEITILSGSVEGKRIEELNSQLRIEIKSAVDSSRIESTFPLPISNFFQVKNLPRGKHLVRIRSSLPSVTHKFESEVIEVDFNSQTQIHLGPIHYSYEDNYHRQQELTTAPVYPLMVGISVIALFISMPRLKDLYQTTMGTYSSSNSVKEVRKPALRKKTY